MSKYSFATTSESMPQAGQVQNDAGGYVYEIAPIRMLERYILLGTDSSTYYVNKMNLTQRFITTLSQCMHNDPTETLAMLAEWSENVVDNNSSSIFALAQILTQKMFNAQNDYFVKINYKVVFKKIIRTLSHLYEWVEYTRDLGWGRFRKTLVSDWLMIRGDLAYQYMKYSERNGYKLVDLINLSHPKANTAENVQLLAYIVAGETGTWLDPYIKDFLECKERVEDEEFVYTKIIQHRYTREIVEKIYGNLPIPKLILRGIIQTSPLNALFKNIGNYASKGAWDDPLCQEKLQGIGPITLEKAKVRPLNILLSQLMYLRGEGFRGNLSWTVDEKIGNILSKLYECSCSIPVEKDDHKILHAIDISGSMSSTHVSGPLGAIGISTGHLACILVTDLLKSQPNATTIFFDTQIRAENSLTKDMDVQSILRLDIDGGGTAISSVFDYMKDSKETFDAVCIWTDNESWAGRHCAPMVDDYRKNRNKNLKVIQCQMTPTEGSTVPEHPYNYNLVGVSVETPRIISSIINL